MPRPIRFPLNSILPQFAELVSVDSFVSALLGGEAVCGSEYGIAEGSGMWQYNTGGLHSEVVQALGFVRN